MLKQLSYIAPVAAVDKNEKYLTRGGRVKQLRILTVLDVWVENESQGTKNEEPPSLTITYK